MATPEAIARLGTETAFSVGARARQLEAEGRSIIHLQIGEPDFPTAPHIIEAAHAAMLAGETHYGPPLGIPAFREASAAYLRGRGVPAESGRMAVAPGAKPLLTFAMMALLSPGDEVLLPDPGFPIYASVVRYLGARPVGMPLEARSGFGLPLDFIEANATPQTRLMILNSPHNPTGAMVTHEEIEAVARVARRCGAYVLSDEMYSRIVYRGQHCSIASLPGMAERTIVLDGMSKTYAMTGWRLGYALLPPELVSPVELLLINSVSCTPAFTQRAGVAALEGPQDAVEEMRREFETRRDFMVAALRGIPGIEVSEPQGAFYLFPNVAAYGDSADIAKALLDDAGVAVLDGGGFGPAGRGFLRISYANSMANLQEAARRIAGFFAARASSPSPSERGRGEGARGRRPYFPIK